MLCQNERTMSTFKERLKQAADYAGVEFAQTAIARSLGITSRQTVDMWMTGSVPRHEMIVHIATTWKVDPVWLGSGQGEMLPSPPPDLSPPERELLQIFRRLNKDRRSSLQAIVRAFAKAVVIALVFALPAVTQQQAEAAMRQPAYYVKWLLRLFSLKRHYLSVIT